MSEKETKQKEAAAGPTAEASKVVHVKDESTPSTHDAHSEPGHAAEHGHAAKHGHAAEHGHHAPNRKEYWQVFAVLLVLTILEVGVAYLQSYVGKTALVTCLVGMALGKAAIVAYFFMHLKHETKEMRWTVVIPMMFPAIYAFLLIAEGTYRALWGT